MPTKSEKPKKSHTRRKVRGQATAETSLNPDELISEINHQSTALQKIVSRFLDPGVGKNPPKNNE
jgi:hypothetical protein